MDDDDLLDLEYSDDLFDSEYGFGQDTYPNTEQRSSLPLNTQVKNSSLTDLRDKVSDMESGLEATQNSIDESTKKTDDVQNRLDAMENYLGEMNETLESRELNIHLIPPDTNVSRLAVQVQLVAAVFVVVIALGRFLVPSAPFTYIGLALGASIATNLLTNKMYPVEE